MSTDWLCSSRFLSRAWTNEQSHRHRHTLIVRAWLGGWLFRTSGTNWECTSAELDSLPVDVVESRSLVRNARRSLYQSCPWVHFVWHNPTHYKWKNLDPTQPNTANNGAYSFVVTYFYTQNLTVSRTCQIGRNIKFNCLVKPNLI